MSTDTKSPSGRIQLAVGSSEATVESGSTWDELLQLADEMSLREQRARADARTAAHNEARLRSRLAFRLGTVLVSDLRPPWRMLRMPFDLVRAYRRYKVDQRNAATSERRADEDVRHFRAGVGHLGVVLRIHWQRVGLPESENDVELWLEPLLRNGEERPVLVEIRNATGSLLHQRVGSAPAGKATASVEACERVAVTLRRSAATLGCRHRGGATAIDLRTTSSRPVVVKLEIRAASSPDRIEADIGGGGASSSLPLAAMPFAPASGSGVSDDVGTEPPAQSGAVLCQAHELMNAGQTLSGIAFARRHATGPARTAVHLLEANAALADESAWLGHVNAYVAQFGVLPIELDPGPGSVFFRLRARSGSSVEAGPLVSILMPAYQAAATIRHAVQSVLRQTWRTLELIVVDDASDDATWTILQRLAASDDRIKLLRNICNVGPYVSKNLALGIAQGAYITGHDADDWAHPQRLERQVVEMLRAGGQTLVSVACMIRMGEQGRFDHISRETRGTDDGVLREATMSCMFESAFMRQRLGHWDTVRFAADSEMIARCERVCGTGFVRLRQLSIICLDRDSSLTNDPVHGISKAHGVSPTRRAYRDHWTRWHRSIGLDQAYLAFPQAERRFEAPGAAIVPREEIDRVVGARVAGGLQPKQPAAPSASGKASLT